MTTTILEREEEIAEATLIDLKVADQATGEGRFYRAGPASADAAVLTPPNVEVHQLESMSNIRLLLSLVTNAALGLYLLARSLDDWLSGPPITEQERTRLSITAADRHWWYWSRL